MVNLGIAIMQAAIEANAKLPIQPEAAADIDIAANLFALAV